MKILTTIILSKWKKFSSVFKDKKKIMMLFLSGLLIFTNWAVWIYAIGNDQVIDASFGYFIMPIISVFLGYFFLKEELSFKTKISLLIVTISILYLVISSFQSIPWVGLIVALSWSFYNLVRKKIDVDTDIGLLVESLFIFPFALIVFYFIFKSGLNDFNFQKPGLSFLLLLAGPMTVIPLFLYVRGVEIIGLGPTGMIFYITPTLQFILGYFYYGEDFSLVKFGSFIIIWIAVIIYLRDLYENY